LMGEMWVDYLSEGMGVRSSKEPRRCIYRISVVGEIEIGILYAGGESRYRRPWSKNFTYQIQRYARDESTRRAVNTLSFSRTRNGAPLYHP
jgi:hypothetical protein